MSLYYYLFGLILFRDIKCHVHDYPLVVGGYKADIEQYPHAMALYVLCKNWRKSLYTCGASVINEWTSLTAAHCLLDCNVNESFYSITAGSDTLHSGFKSTVKAFYYHKRFNRTIYGDDIGLLRLTTKLTYGKKIKPVKIMRDPPYDAKPWLAGWGRIQEEPPRYTQILYAIDQALLPDSVCYRYVQNFVDRGLCAQSESEEAHVTVGDSGSALVVRGSIQIGIASFKYFNTSLYITAYTKVAYFHDWIKKHAERLRHV